jgi:flap endonuclease-1
MGIKGLTQLIGDTCPEALKETEVKHYFGRKVAIDASMALYAFLISIRPDTGIWLTDEAGETTRCALDFTLILLILFVA